MRCTHGASKRRGTRPRHSTGARDCPRWRQRAPPGTECGGLLAKFRRAGHKPRCETEGPHGYTCLSNSTELTPLSARPDAVSASEGSAHSLTASERAVTCIRDCTRSRHMQTDAVELPSPAACLLKAVQKMCTGSCDTLRASNEMFVVAAHVRVLLREERWQSANLRGHSPSLQPLATNALQRRLLYEFRFRCRPFRWLQPVCQSFLRHCCGSRVDKFEILFYSSLVADAFNRDFGAAT